MNDTYRTEVVLAYVGGLHDDPSGHYWRLDLSSLKPSSGGDCALIDSALDILVVCAQSGEMKLGFTLKYHTNPSDPSNFYWKLDLASAAVK